MAAYTHFFFVFLLTNFLPTTFAFSPTNHIPPPYNCHDHEKSALLQFKDSFIIDSSASADDPAAYPKSEGWKLDGSDCCSWDGIECDDITGHVISLDLSGSCLSGSIDSSSSLFQLLHLRSLNLAFNDFSHSSIPFVLGHLLPNLAHLNLSYSGFSGPIPSSISNLSKLSSLDLSSNLGLELKTNPDFKTLQVLHLDHVDMSSIVPNDILANSSSLVSLSLVGCDLQGVFPARIFQLPKLEVLLLDNNYNLTGYFFFIMDGSSDQTHSFISSQLTFKR
ncbi:hypothetical protein Tsubulata_031665 [Turnera subulata]|uniref:Leucine-rich repeat-containing N-terminal plant-type domain-containing protein n=1 Tax=Turnera subulata TaxID=218843 RepID=A0A9Q0FRR1_9ROSI|nr:hypothetical protein Tsubulata_031665 [Turnera subulata]